MVTYVWMPEETVGGYYVYLNNTRSTEVNEQAAAQSQELAAQLVYDEDGYAEIFNQLKSNGWLNDDTVANGYRHYWVPNTECFYGVCDVQATIYETQDRQPRVKTNLQHTTNGTILFIDFYNINGHDGINGISGEGSYIDYRYGTESLDFTANYGLDSEDAYYMGTATSLVKVPKESPLAWTAYTWVKIVGEKGEPGSAVAWGDLTEEQKEALRQQLRGRDGADGEPGAPGNAAFKSIVFTRTNSASGPGVPDGGSYENPLPTTEGWSDGVPEGKEKLWMSTRIFTSDSGAPQQSGWTTPEIAADNTYMDYEFSSASTKPVSPEKESPDEEATEPWHNEATEDDIWMAYRPVDNGEYKVGSNWVITKIKGEDGEDGQGFTLGDPWDIVDIFRSTPGEDNNEYHVFTGSGDTTEGYSEYHGYLYKWEDDENPDPASCPPDIIYTGTGKSGKWVKMSRFEGTPGASYFTHIKYANKVLDPESDEECLASAWTVTWQIFDNKQVVLKLTGTGDTESIRGEETGRYIGILADTNENDTRMASAYTWTPWVGRDGYGVEYIYTWSSAYTAPIVPVCDTASTDYQKSDYIPREDMGDITSGYTWSDNPVDISPEHPYVWVASRKNVDSTWLAFTGNIDHENLATLFAKFSKDGDTPTAQFTSVVYKVSEVVPERPHNESGVTEEVIDEEVVYTEYNTYEHPVPNPEEGWFDTITGMEPHASVWMATRIFVTDPDEQESHIWSTPIKANDTDTIDYEWHEGTGYLDKTIEEFIIENGYPEKTSPDEEMPQPDGHGWYDEPINGAVFMAMVEVVNGAYKRRINESGNEVIDWKISKIKGERGVAGQPFVLKEAYTGERLFNIENGTDPESGKVKMYDSHVCTEDYTGTTDLGVLLVFKAGNLYTWDGDSWSDSGKFAPDSKYIHIKYADESTEAAGGEYIDYLGRWIKFTESSGEQPGEYMGVLNDKVEEDSMVVSAYTWSKVRGKDGFGYEYIYCVTEAEPESYGGFNIPVPHLEDDHRFNGYGDIFSGGIITNEDSYQNDDFVPTVVNDKLIWKDEPGQPTAEKPFCYMAYRKRVEGIWSEYRGTGTDGKFGSLFTRFVFDGSANYAFDFNLDSCCIPANKKDDGTFEVSEDVTFETVGKVFYGDRQCTITDCEIDVPTGVFEDSTYTIEDSAVTVTLNILKETVLTDTVFYPSITVSAKTISPTGQETEVVKTFTDTLTTYVITNGEDGEAAKIYGVIPSATQIRKDGTAYTPSAITCQIYEQVGADRIVYDYDEESHDLFAGLTYSIDGEEALSYTGSIPTTAVTERIYLELEVDGQKYWNGDILVNEAIKGDDGLDGPGSEYIYILSCSGDTSGWTVYDKDSEGNLLVNINEDGEIIGGSGYTVSGSIITTGTWETNSSVYQTNYDFIPSGWTDEPVSVTSAMPYEFISKRMKVFGDTASSWSVFSKPAIWARYSLDAPNVSSVTEYYKATSAMTPTPVVGNNYTGWTKGSIPTDYNSTNKYLWNFEDILYTDGNRKHSEPSMIGEYSKSISGIVEYYAVSSGQTTPPAGWNTDPVGENWATDPTQAATTEDKPYLWNFERIVYTDGTYEVHAPAVIGTRGTNGAPGAKGDPGEKGDTGEKGDPATTYEIRSNYESRIITINPDGTITGVPDDGEDWAFSVYKQTVGEPWQQIEEAYYKAVVDDINFGIVGPYSAVDYSYLTDDADLPLSSFTLYAYSANTGDDGAFLSSKTFNILQNGQKGDPGEPDDSLNYLKKIFKSGVTIYSGATLSDFMGVLDENNPDNFPVAFINGSNKFVEGEPFIESGSINRIMLAAGVSGAPSDIIKSIEVGAVRYHESEGLGLDIYLSESYDYFYNELIAYRNKHEESDPFGIVTKPDGTELFWLPLRVKGYVPIFNDLTSENMSGNIPEYSEVEYIWGTTINDVTLLPDYSAMTFYISQLEDDNYVVPSPAAVSIDLQSQPVRDIIEVIKKSSTISASTVIYEDGKLVTKKADIDGKITANEGNIGGLTVSNSGLSYSFNSESTEEDSDFNLTIDPETGSTLHVKNAVIDGGIFKGTMRPGMAFKTLAANVVWGAINDSNLDGKYDVIQYLGSRKDTADAADEIGWDVNSIGRRILLICSDGLSSFGGGMGGDIRFKMTAPDDCYFFEDGILHKELLAENEMVELLGYGYPKGYDAFGTTKEWGKVILSGPDSVFLGYIVLKRINITTKSSYGHESRQLCHAKIGIGGVVKKQHTFDGCPVVKVTQSTSGTYQDASAVTIYKQTEGVFQIGLPYNWFNGRHNDKMGVTLTAYSDGDNDMWANIAYYNGMHPDYGFIVATGPCGTNTRQDTVFEFTVQNFGDWSTLTKKADIPINPPVSAVTSDITFNWNDDISTKPKTLLVVIKNIPEEEAEQYTMRSAYIVSGSTYFNMEYSGTIITGNAYSYDKRNVQFIYKVNAISKNETRYIREGQAKFIIDYGGSQYRTVFSTIKQNPRG